jgi:hypothetical protein
MSWYKIHLTLQQVGWGREEKAIIEKFSLRSVTRQLPGSVALFDQSSGAGTDLFFSPDSVPEMADILAQYGGVPCEQPPRSVGLLYGTDPASWLLVRPPIE